MEGDLPVIAAEDPCERHVLLPTVGSSSQENGIKRRADRVGLETPELGRDQLPRCENSRARASLSEVGLYRASGRALCLDCFCVTLNRTSLSPSSPLLKQLAAARRFHNIANTLPKCLFGHGQLGPVTASSNWDNLARGVRLDFAASLGLRGHLTSPRTEAKRGSRRERHDRRPWGLHSPLTTVISVFQHTHGPTS